MKHTITIEGLPEGWKAVAYRCPKSGEKFILEGEIHTAFAGMAYPHLIVQKIQPRRIVLEETGETNVNGNFIATSEGINIDVNGAKIWREVKEE